MLFVLDNFVVFLRGFAHTILDVLNKHSQELLHIDRSVLILIQTMMYMGYFITVIPAGLFITISAIVGK